MTYFKEHKTKKCPLKAYLPIKTGTFLRGAKVV
jgi:hypothetical protein